MVEDMLGKEEAVGSIPTLGSIPNFRVRQEHFPVSPVSFRPVDKCLRMQQGIAVEQRVVTQNRCCRESLYRRIEQ